MKYIADILTGFRVLSAFAAAGFILANQWLAALVVSIAAILSDAIDGYCARRWPYSAEDEVRVPWRHLDAHLLDNIPDGLLVALTVFTLALKIDYWWWLIAVIYGVSAVFFLTVQWLTRRGKPRAAELVDVVYGWWFATNLVMVLLELARRSGYLWPTIIVGLALAIPLVHFKRDRALTRPETRKLAEAYQRSHQAT